MEVMSLADRVPGMQSGRTKRNIALSIGYFTLIPIIIAIAIVALPFAAAFAVARNYGGVAERLEPLPGISSGGGATAGVAAFVYVVFIFAIVGAIGGATSDDDPVTGVDDADVTPTVQPTAGQDQTPPPDQGDAGTRTAEQTGKQDTTPTADQGEGGIQQVVARTYSDYGTLTGISDDGNLAAFGLHTGQFAIYDVRAGSFKSYSGGVSRQPSHIELRNDGYATVAWIDADRFGALDTTSGRGGDWQVEYEGVWDIDTNADQSSVAAVTSPIQGPGRVGVTTGTGDIVWDNSLKDAGAQAVAMDDAGDYVAVGAVKYSTGGASREGTPGVRLYDATSGEKLLEHKTTSDVLSVAVDSNREIIVAGTNEGGIVVLNFDGNVLWETSEAGGWVKLSGDGSTVVTAKPSSLVAYDAKTGEERWRATDVPGWAGEYTAVSEDSSRVAASAVGSGWVWVVDSGEVIWKQEHQKGPAWLDISADGATWSVIIQNNNNGNARVEVYRDQSHAS